MKSARGAFAIPSLDGIRAVAVLTVFIGHGKLIGGPWPGDPYRLFGTGGAASVIGNMARISGLVSSQRAISVVDTHTPNRVLKVKFPTLGATR